MSPSLILNTVTFNISLTFHFTDDATAADLNVLTYFNLVLFQFYSDKNI